MSSGEDTILHPTKRYASIGRCIYCGDTKKPRGEEHIVARALAGNRIIFDDASCRDCEAMINRFEQPAHKAIFGPMRAKFGLHGKRRKGKKPGTHIALPILDKHPKDGGQPIAKIAVPVADYPVWFIGLVMQQPTLLASAKPDTPHYKLWMRYDQEIPPPLSSLTNRAVEVGAINPLIFAQVLAKIAYGYAVAEYGYATFLSLLHPLLQGKTEDFENVVGGDSEVPPARSDVLFHLRLAEVQRAGLTYVVVEIRLWPMLGTPNYRVVVGVLSPNFVKGPAHSPTVKVPSQ